MDSACAQPLHFERETIDVAVRGGFCILTGTYSFRNNTPERIDQTLFYPFVINDSLPFPHAIKVRELLNGRVLEYCEAQDGISFAVSIPAHGIGRYEVTYVQNTPFNFFEYILTTTARWRVALEEAEYLVRIPDDYLLTRFSMPGGTSERRGDETIRRVTKKSFMPSANLTVQWQRRRK